MAKKTRHALDRLPPDLPGAGRLQVVDLVRGIAIVLMLAYHFSFDLMFFGVLQTNMYRDPFWIQARTSIVTLFLLTMGMSLYLATRDGVRWPRFWRRIGAIAAGAAVVSLGSYFVFPKSWIFFGVLHFIAIASVLGLLFVRLYWTNLALGVGILVLAAQWSSPFFNDPAWSWLGLMTKKPITEDYVPLVPWFAMVLLGIFLGRTLFGGGWAARLARWQLTDPASRLLAWGGRHSLAIYLVHQPVFFAVLWPVFGR